MKKITQPNDYTCTAASVATVTGIPIARLFELCGHDGSGMIRGSRMGHCPDEFVVPLLQEGWLLSLQSAGLSTHEGHCKRYPGVILTSVPGIIWGMTRPSHKIMGSQMHTVAWDGEKVLDPSRVRRTNTLYETFTEVWGVGLVTYLPSVGVKTLWTSGKSRAVPSHL